MPNEILEISLFGTCIVRSCTPERFEITSAKHRALFVLLATAPFGRRSRTFLQDTLWGVSCYDSGRQSLRRALSDIKIILGDDYGKLITTNYSDVTINLDLVKFVTQPEDGLFLEGLKIKEKLFLEWLDDVRREPERVNFAANHPSDFSTKNIVPSITVLPFNIVLGDDNHRVLGDWVAEEICRSLSRSNLLHVVSHLSSRVFAKSTVDISSVRSVLGVDYCLVGSIRVDGDRAIIDADFINTDRGQLLWTRRFSGPLRNFLGEASEGLDEIVRAVGGMLATDSLRYIQDREIHTIEDHRLLIAGVELMHKATLAEFAKSRELVTEALNRAPRSAEIHAWLGKWYTLSVFNGWSSDTARDTQAAIDCTARALDINPENSFCLTIDGFAQNNLLQKLDIAESRYQRALRANPNQALGWLLTGTLNVFRDNPEKAVEASTKARSLSPIDPFGYFYDAHIASTHLASKQYQAALELIERSLMVNNRHLSTMRMKISALYHLGRLDEASSAARMLLRQQPHFRVADYLENHPAAKFTTGKEIAEAMRASGIPN